MFACPIKRCAVLTSTSALHRFVQYVCLKQYGVKSSASGRGGRSSFLYVFAPIEMFISRYNLSRRRLYDDRS